MAMDLESAKRRLQSGDSETRELIECAIDQSREAHALTNVAKHSNASECRLSARAGEGVLTVEVHDNGRCGAHIGKGTGLAGLQDRLAGVDGALEIDPPDAGGTTVRISIPASVIQPV